MRLSGWHRLWILLSAIYFILVSSYVILEFPKAEDIQHQSDFYKKLSKKSAGMINPTNYEDALALGGNPVYAAPESSPKGRWVDVEDIDIHPIIELPNKHNIEFKAKVSEEDMKIACDEYWRIVKQKATEVRLHLLFYAFIFWIAPCLGLYALGWSISWVYKGFKQKKDTQQ